MSFASVSRCLQQTSRTFARTKPPRSVVLPTRYFSSSARRWLEIQRPIAQPTHLLSLPSKEYLEEEEIDAKVLAPEDVSLTITDRAAEQLRAIAKREGNPDAALRIAVDSGGCHGYQYKMELAKSRAGDDYQFTHPTIQPSNILVDAISLGLLNGSTVDFATELIGSSFRVTENPHAKGSGCGCGVSWELKT
ncbi:hypothetical protein BDZ89DRAFT_1022129 [Hymenopellis radicata]|nr:hypothetical protein BDZ89DRAFT_1022129 [Hymenopellis radicata]